MFFVAREEICLLNLARGQKSLATPDLEHSLFFDHELAGFSGFAKMKEIVKCKLTGIRKKFQLLLVHMENALAFDIMSNHRLFVTMQLLTLFFVLQ